jgi:hypothetical protein
MVLSYFRAIVFKTKKPISYYDAAMYITTLVKNNISCNINIKNNNNTINKNKISFYLEWKFAPRLVIMTGEGKAVSRSLSEKNN